MSTVILAPGSWLKADAIESAVYTVPAVASGVKSFTLQFDVGDTALYGKDAIPWAFGVDVMLSVDAGKTFDFLAGATFDNSVPPSNKAGVDKPNWHTMLFYVTPEMAGAQLKVILRFTPRRGEPSRVLVASPPPLLGVVVL